eukprot:1389633-Amorphochlora_amoeboformis.AAC.2
MLYPEQGWDGYFFLSEGSRVSDPRWRCYFISCEHIRYFSRSKILGVPFNKLARGLGCTNYEIAVEEPFLNPAKCSGSSFPPKGDIIDGEAVFKTREAKM